jgi:hypothetical protein
MFHWICPECGREIPPTVQECPACDPKAIAAEAAAPVVAESVLPPIPGQVPVVVPPLVPPQPLPVPAAVSPPLATPADPPGLRELAIALGIIDEPAAPTPTPPLASVPALAPPLAIEAPQAAIALLAPPLAAAAVEPATPPLESPAPEISAPGPVLAMAPLRDYFPRAGRAIRPALPKTRILAADSGPRITLPGPALPPALLSLKDARVVTVLGETAQRSKRGVPGWLVSLFVTSVLLVSGLTILFYLLPHSTADAKPAAPTAAAPTAAAAPIAQTPSHSLTSNVEVTGFRIVVDFNKKSEIHYIVVNHSAANLSDVNIFVTLRSANTISGQPPIGRFSFKSPDLAPFEAKEMISSIEKLSRSTTLPDWQDLRAEVQIAQ